MYTLSQISRDDVAQNRDAIREGLIDMMATNYVFIDAIAFSTSAKERVDKRFLFTKQYIDEVLKVSGDNVTRFSLENKTDMLKENPLCAFCGEEIHDPDDAAIAGIDKYWIPNASLPEKIFFAHRYCNRHNL